MQFFLCRKIVKSQRGAVAIVVGVSFIMLLGFAALSIDIGNLLVARGELQNAADAGALAGARFLYNETGTQVNVNADEIAMEAAVANASQNKAVEVALVQRGHYSFTNEAFTPNNATDPPNLEMSESDLDLPASNFINAVRVRVERNDTPVTAFFSGLFSSNDLTASAEAIGYIGFAGRLYPGESDQPIALCQQALRVDGSYSCSIGRMINSGNDASTSNTGGWTSYNQNNPCSGGTNASEMKDLVCEDGNPDPILFGEDIATIGGQLQSVFSDFYDCWKENTDTITSWQMTLPVVDCPGNNIGPCQEVVGAVTVNIIWIVDSDHSNNQNKFNDDAPSEMKNVAGYEDWPTADDLEISDWSENPHARWDSFVDHFNLKNLNQSGDGLVDAPYAQKSIYFLPDCEPHEPRGRTGGRNFGILAKIPVLVQ